MLKNISKLLVLLATIQFTNVNGNEKENMNMESDQVNNIFDSLNNYNNNNLSNENNNNLNSNNDVNIDKILDKVGTAFHAIKNIEKSKKQASESYEEDKKTIKDALKFLGKNTYNKFMKRNIKIKSKKNKVETRKETKILKVIHLLDEEIYTKKDNIVKGFKKIEGNEEQIINSIIAEIEKKYRLNNITNIRQKKIKLIKILNKIKSDKREEKIKRKGRLEEQKEENMKTINDNVPVIVSNLNRINDSKYINTLREIGDTIITNEQDKSEISKKLNDLAKPIVDSFRIEEGDNKNIDLDDFNDHSKGATYILWLSAQ